MTLTLMVVRCGNRFCREVMKTGKAQIVAEIDSEARGGNFKCPKCREITRFRK